MAQLRGGLRGTGAHRDETGGDGSLSPDAFRSAVLAVVARIPEGKVASYVQVALMAGYPRRPRQVGMVLKGLPPDTGLPWHRVVNNHGHIPSRGRWWGALEQAARLKEEGILVDAEGNLDIARFRWNGEEDLPRRRSKAFPSKPRK